MVSTILKCSKFAYKFQGYEPQAVTPMRVYRWLNQFSPSDRATAVLLLDKVIYFSRQRVIKGLIEQNQALHDFLAKAGISPRNFIYIHIDEPGSSSSMMIDLLRNHGPLRRVKSHWIDYSNQGAIIKAINQSGSAGAAVIYVDDFLRSGRQFCKSRDFAVQFFPTGTPELLVAPCLCEEAYSEVSKRGINVFTSLVHAKADRPLHANSFLLSREKKDRMRQIGLSLSETFGLGFQEMAAMVAMYRNAPNNMPLILRGAVEQQSFVGILPRRSDLPASEL